jgi:hypothetical protein
MIGLTWLSERFKDRAIFTAVQSLWTLPLLITLRFWSGVVKNVWGTYALVTVLLSYPAGSAILVGWISRNSNSVGTRTMALTIQNSKQYIYAFLLCPVRRVCVKSNVHELT